MIMIGTTRLGPRVRISAETAKARHDDTVFRCLTHLWRTRGAGPNVPETCTWSYRVQYRVGWDCDTRSEVERPEFLLLVATRGGKTSSCQIATIFILKALNKLPPEVTL
jgi:hypothetical protein